MELPGFQTPRKSAESGLPRSPLQLSSEDLSSPPRSSPEAASPSVQSTSEALQKIPTSTSSSSSTTTSALSIVISGVQSEKPPPQRKPRRKPKDASTISLLKTTQLNSQLAKSVIDTEAPPKPKRIRKPKDPNAPPTQRRKKNPAPNKNVENDADSRVATTKTMQFSSSEPILASSSAPNVFAQTNMDDGFRGTIESFFNNAPVPLSQVQSKEQVVRTSGQKYDPIRSSSNYDPVRETVLNHNLSTNSNIPLSNPNSSNQGIIPPSIYSLECSQNQQQTSTALPAQNFFNQKQTRIPPCDAHVTLPSTASNGLDSLAVVNKSEITGPLISGVISNKYHSVSSSPQSKKCISNSIVPVAHPKPGKSKECKEVSENIVPIPPPLPGSGNDTSDGTEYRAPTVILCIPMNGEVNKYVNFTRLAEQQYGWDALHPRLAAQRDRLARVAAAGAALERSGSNKDSGDEMSLDSEAEGSNAEMGGMSDGRPDTEYVKKVPKKRKTREDEYDKHDGFVDDTELLWEEHAAAANDGFFVYSGPLVPEGEKAGIESKTDNATKRGRGRGSRGGASRGTGARGGAASSATTARNNLPATGPGSRGGTGVRKPRVTKAERARIEQERFEHEKAGATSNQSFPNNEKPLANTLPDESVLLVPS